MTVRAATPKEINEAFERQREKLGRAMTSEEVQVLDAKLAELTERDLQVLAISHDNVDAIKLEFEAPLKVLVFSPSEAMRVAVQMIEYAVLLLEKRPR